MDKNNNRILAYQKSKLITEFDLKKISGGFNFTSGVSGGPSGGTGNNADAQSDVHFDW